jgi:hypothetical protein
MLSYAKLTLLNLTRLNPIVQNLFLNLTFLKIMIEMSILILLKVNKIKTHTEFKTVPRCGYLAQSTQ